MNNTALKIQWCRSADRKGPRKMLGLELGETRSKAILISRRRDRISIDRVSPLPGFETDGGSDAIVQALNNENFSADYVSMVVLSDDTLLRLAGFPGRPGTTDLLEQQVRQTLGVDDSYSVCLEIIREGGRSGKPEYSVLACAMRSALRESCRRLADRIGSKPVSLVLGGICLANLIHACPDLLKTDVTLGFLYIGSTFTELLLFCGHDLAVIRRFKFGGNNIIQALQEKLSLDHATAEKLYANGSIDIGAEILPALAPWLHQILISLDFCERRYGQSVKRLYLIGEDADPRALETVVAAKVGRPVKLWSPFEESSVIDITRAGADADCKPYLLALCESLRVMKAGVAS